MEDQERLTKARGDRGPSLMAPPTRRYVTLIAMLSLSACATSPAPVEPFMPAGSSVLFEAVVGENSVEGILGFLSTGEVSIESRWATCRPRESNPLQVESRGGYGVHTILPSSTPWIRRSAFGIRISCGNLRLSLEEEGGVLAGRVEIRASEFVREQTKTCLRYGTDPETHQRICIQYQYGMKTVERRVWSPAMPVVLSIRDKP